MIVFNWQLDGNLLYGGGGVENWFSSSLWQHRRFVFNAFKRGCAIGVDLPRREAQIVWFATGERKRVKFDDVKNRDLGDALHAIADLGDIPDCDVVRRLVSRLLKYLRFKISEDEISSGAMDDLKSKDKR